MTRGLQLLDGPLFADRVDAGKALVGLLGDERGSGLVVVGLARGGVETAAEVARALAAPLDVIAVRKIGHPWQPEYALGAVTPGGGVYIRSADALTAKQLAKVVAETREKATLLDRSLHASYPALELGGKTALVVDDGLATGATMVAALRSARAAGAARVVAAIPVAAAASIELIRPEADRVVCPHVLELFFAVGAHYVSFGQVDDDAVIQLIGENRRQQSSESATSPR